MWFIIPLQVWMLLLGVVTFAYWYIRNQFSFWPKQGVAFRKPHWLYGNVEDWFKVKTSVANFTSDVYKEFRSERFCGLWGFYSPILFVIDPELIRYILVIDSEPWSERGFPHNSEQDPLSATLVNLEGKRWKSVRKNLTPAYTPGKLKQMFNLLLQCGEDLEKYPDALVATGGIIEAKEMSARLVVDMNSLCALGIEMNSLRGQSPLYEKMKRAHWEPTLRETIVSQVATFFPRWYKLLRLKTQPQEITDHFLNIVKQNFDYREKNNVKRQDFTDLIMSLKNTGKPLGEDEIAYDDKLLAAQAFDFLLGGFESTSGMISFCLHELAFNEDIQNRLREEVHSSKAANNGEITWDGFNNMKYLDMVVQETFRKYPTVPIGTRMNTKPYVIPDTDVSLPVGTMCIIPVYALHHDPEYYPDPEKFNPERFTFEAKSQRPAFTFLPFGAGPRNCIGLRLGEHQVKVAIIKVIDKFKVSFCEKTELPLELSTESFYLLSKDGIWLRISQILSN